MACVRAWIRWNLPVRRETACHLIEDECETYYQMLDRRLDSLYRQIMPLIVAMARELRDAGVPEYQERLEAGDSPGPAPVTQRDLDDAVAELIRDARQEFGPGGAQ